MPSAFSPRQRAKLIVRAGPFAPVCVLPLAIMALLLAPVTIMARTPVSGWDGDRQERRQESVVTSTLSLTDTRRTSVIAEGLQEISGVPAAWFRREIERLLSQNRYGLYLQIDGSSDSISVEIIRGPQQSAYVTLRADGRNAGAAQLSRRNVRGEVAFIWVNHARSRHYQIDLPADLSVVTLVRDTEVLLSTQMLTGPGPWSLVSGPTGHLDQ
jgi:hypothetical protein